MHTKGKWTVHIDSMGGRTVKLGKSNWTARNFLTKADANLIAAAPELLEACKVALKIIISTQYYGMSARSSVEAMIVVKSAIAEAESIE